MFIQEHNCETGEITMRELTAAEIKSRETLQKAAKAKEAEAEARATEKAALLERLGITESEAKLLLS